MISIIGLGKFCSNLINGFSKYPQYNIFTISTDKKNVDNHISMLVRKTAEDYENSLPNIKTFLDKLGDEVYVFLDGSESISGITLGILQKINKKKKIFYIKSDIELMSDIEKLQDKIAFNVLQEYARSGLFEVMYIFDKIKLEEIIGNIPITQYDAGLSNLICSAIHMCNVYANSESIMNNITDSDIVNKIGSIGIGDLSSGEIKWFYNLQNVNEIMYYYAINTETLERDDKLLQKIKKQIKDKQIENCKIMFGVYETKYDQNFVYCVSRSKIIQQLSSP